MKRIATNFKTTNGDLIYIGDWLDFYSTNQYNGQVGVCENGTVILKTAFFDKPLADHLSALDLEHCEIAKQPL